MGKKQREERKVSIQEARRFSLGSGSAALATRPPDRLTIGQIVERSHPDQGLEQHLSDVQSSTSFFDTVRSIADEEGPVVVSPVLQKEHLEGETDASGSLKAIDEENTERRKAKRWAYKNVYGLSLAYVVVFTAFIGLQNLQSSINSAGGLGLVTLSLLYAMFIAAGFITPGFLKLFGTKYSLLFGFLCHLVYTLANFYPSWYTLVPGSILIGFASAPIWAAASTHLAEVAVTVAPSLRKKQDYLISKFTALFFFFFQFSQVPGNLASSLILFPYSDEESSSLLSSIYTYDWNTSTVNESSDLVCNALETTGFDVKYLYILVSVYVLFIVTGIVLLLVFVDRLPTSNSFFSTEKKLELYLKNPLLELMKVLKNVKMLLIAPMVVYNGMELAFAFGSFTEHYISQCFGTYMVGFVLIVLGLCSSLSSVAIGRFLKYLPRFAIVLFGASLSVTTILFMVMWQREPSFVAFFVIAAVWGSADAVWTTVPTSLTGILFSGCSDVAYSAMRIWQAVGFTIGFAMAEFLTFQGRLCVLLGTVIVAAIANLVIEFTTQDKEELLPCVFRRRRHKSCDNGESGDTSNGSESLSNSSISSSPDPGLGTRKEDVATNELDIEHNNSGQNPIFVMYQGRRPSTMSTYTTDSLDGAIILPPSANSDAPVVPTGQNPLFIMHQGRRPSVVSTYSADSLDGTMPSLSSSSDIRILVPVEENKYFDLQEGRIPSTGSHIHASANRRGSATSVGRDSLDGTLPLLSSHSDEQFYPPPPLTITTTVACATRKDLIRALSPINECEDHENENENESSSVKPRPVPIHRSDSYVAALNSVSSTELVISKC